MVKAPPSVAATSTLAMVRTAEARGFETADLLAGAGVTRAFLDDPDARIPGPMVLALWNALRERTGDPALQLVASESLPFGAYRVIDYLVEASDTVGDGMNRFARFFRLIADGVGPQISHDDGEHRLSLQMADGRALPPVYVDYVFATLVRRIRSRIRPALEVRRVELRQTEPAHGALYRELFRADICFGAGADRLCFTEEEWNAPTENADAALARLLEDHARMIAQRHRQNGSDLTAAVQTAIAASPAQGGSVEEVARALHVSVRTLQRKLVAAGTSFREVSDSCRGRLAEGYLSDPHVSIAEVAFLLGFSDQSSFHRAFRRWTGQSPGRWRRQHA